MIESMGDKLKANKKNKNDSMMSIGTATVHVKKADGV